MDRLSPAGCRAKHPVNALLYWDVGVWRPGQNLGLFAAFLHSFLNSFSGVHCSTGGVAFANAVQHAWFSVMFRQIHVKITSI